MGDYGLKVSQPGHDVESATPAQLVMTSSYNSLKLPTTLQGSSTQSVPANSDLTFTITHSLGYVPAFDAWFLEELGHWHSFFRNTELTSYIAEIYVPTGYNQYSDSTAIHLKVHNRDTVSAHNVTIYYVIFIEDVS